MHYFTRYKVSGTSVVHQMKHQGLLALLGDLRSPAKLNFIAQCHEDPGHCHPKLSIQLSKQDNSHARALLTLQTCKGEHGYRQMSNTVRLSTEPYPYHVFIGDCIQS